MVPKETILNWMLPFIEYLAYGLLPPNKWEARRLKHAAKLCRYGREAISMYSQKIPSYVQSRRRDQVGHG